MPRHDVGLFQSHEIEHRRRHVADATARREGCGTVRLVDVEQRNWIRRVRRVRGAGDRILHQLAVAVVRSDEQRAARCTRRFDDAPNPGIDGFEALKQLKSFPDTRHIPVIALTANAMPSDVKRGLEAGFLQYLTKPIDVKEFLRTIDLFLTGSVTKSAKAARSVVADSASASRRP